MKQVMTRSFSVVAGWIIAGMLVFPQEHVLEYALSSGGMGSARLLSLERDHRGSILAVGDYRGTLSWDPAVSPDPEQFVAFVCRVSVKGYPEWFSSFHSSGPVSINTLTVRKGEPIICTGTFSDTLFYKGGTLPGKSDMGLFMAKLDSAGNILSCHTLIYPFLGYFSDLVVLDDGSFCGCGIFEGTILAGETRLKSHGKKDIVLCHFNQDGKLLWVRQAGSRGNDLAAGLVMWDGNYCLGGTFSGNIQIADSQLVSAGREDIFLALFKQDGKLYRAVREGGRGSDRMEDLLVDSLGRYWYTGQLDQRWSSFLPGSDKNLFLESRDQHLNALFMLKGEGPGEQTGLRLAMEESGTIYFSALVGDRLNLGPFALGPWKKQRHLVLGQLEGGDTITWIKSLEGPGEGFLHSIASSGKGEICLGGSFSGTFRAGGQEMKAKGDKDIFLLQYFDPCRRIFLDLGPDRVLCPGATDTLRAQDGFASFDWNTGAWDRQEWIVEEPGEYTLRATCPYGCVMVDTVRVIQGTLEVSPELRKESIPPGSNGAICLNVSGNHPPFSCEWTRGDTNLCLEQLEGGLYQFTVTDQAGCSQSLELELETEWVYGIELKADPNPFVQLTEISYTIPGEEQVELSLYNQSGERLKILFRGPRSPGTYRFDLNRQELSPGIYILQLRAGSQVISRKIMISGLP